MEGKGSGNFRMEMVTGKTNHVIGGLEFSAPGPDLWEKEQGWRLNLITEANHLINRGHVIKSSQKPHNHRFQGTPWLVNTLMC